jgi:hypothetical protein
VGVENQVVTAAGFCHETGLKFTSLSRSLARFVRTFNLLAD